MAINRNALAVDFRNKTAIKVQKWIRAYFCYLDRDGELIVEETTVQRDLCAQPEAAAWEIYKRRIMMVAANDMIELRRFLVRLMAEKQ